MASTITLGKLEIRTDAIDPSSGVYEFNEILIDNLSGFYSARFMDRIPPSSPIDTAKSKIIIRSKFLKVSQTSFSYSEEGMGISTGWHLPDAEMKLASFDLGRQKLNGGFVRFNQPAGYVFLKDGKDTSTTTADTGNSFRILSSSVTIKAGKFHFKRDQKESFKYQSAFNPSDFRIDPFNATAKNLIVSDSISAHIKYLNAKESSGFEIRKANADFSFSEKHVLFENLFLQTKNSHLANYLSLSVPSWQEISDHPEMLGITAHLAATHIDMSELLYFVPEFRNDTSTKMVWNKIIDATGIITGSLNELQLKTSIITITQESCFW